MTAQAKTRAHQTDGARVRLQGLHQDGLPHGHHLLDDRRRLHPTHVVSGGALACPQASHRLLSSTWLGEGEVVNIIIVNGHENKFCYNQTYWL